MLPSSFPSAQTDFVLRVALVDVESQGLGSALGFALACSSTFTLMGLSVFICKMRCSNELMLCNKVEKAPKLRFKTSLHHLLTM